MAAAVEPSGEGAYVEALRDLIEQLAVRSVPAEKPLARVLPLRPLR